MELRSIITCIISFMFAFYIALYLGGAMVGIGGIAISILCILIILIEFASTKGPTGESTFNIKKYAWLSLPLLFIEFSIIKYCYTIQQNLPYINNMTMPKSWYQYTFITNIILFIKIVIIYFLLNRILDGLDTSKMIMALYVIGLILAIYISICSTIAFSFRTDG